jgi:hypothetical protein
MLLDERRIDDDRTATVLTATERNLGLLWVAAVVLGWIVGFFLCEAIEDFFSTFFVDGLVIGSAIGIGQALVLRKRIAKAVPWILLSIIGFGIGKFFSDMVGQSLTGPVGMAVGGALIGLLVGVTQSVALAERFQNAWWWIAANTLAWAAGWIVIGLAEASVDSIAMLYLVGSSGAAVVGVITAIALIGLTRHPHPAPLPSQETNAEP